MAPIPYAGEWEFARPDQWELARILNASREVEAVNILAVPHSGAHASAETGRHLLAEAAERVGGDRGAAVLHALRELPEDGPAGNVGARAFIDLVLNSTTRGDGFPSIWITKPDGTAGVDSELVSPIIPAGPAGDKLVRVALGALALGGVEVSVKCGFHVHFGAVSRYGHITALRRPGQSQADALKGAAMKRAQVWLTEVYQYFNGVIDSVLPRSRRGSARMCGGCEMATAENWFLGSKGRNENRKREFIHNPHRSAGGSGGDYGRYYKVNFAALDRHGTVEFRQHQGTINATKSLMWARVCAALWVRAVNPAYSHLDVREFSADIGEMCSCLGLGQKTHRYLAGRARHFDFAAMAGGDYDRSRGRQLRPPAERLATGTENTATSGSAPGRG